MCPGEDWRSARLQGSSPQHILQPMDFAVQLAKCMVDNDARMPRCPYRPSLIFPALPRLFHPSPFIFSPLPHWHSVDTPETVQPMSSVCASGSRCLASCPCCMLGFQTRRSRVWWAWSKASLCPIWALPPPLPQRRYN